jgi:hypothetical protein
MTTRRQFVRLSSLAGLGACVRAVAQYVPVDPNAPPAIEPPAVPAAPVAPVAPTTPTMPAAGPLVSETEPAAVAVGYVNDARRADRARFPRFVPGQHCGNCQHYLGPGNAPKAPCQQFSGREVQGPGWCSSHQLRVG